MRIFLSSRSMAAFACGTVAGLAAGRLFPPLVASAAGAARVTAGRDPFEPLIADHRRFVDLLDNMAESRPGSVLRRTQLLLRLKRGLAAHAMAEEDVVYPLLSDRAKAAEDARRLYGEHAEMKMLLFRLEQTPKAEPGWSRLARDLRTLVAEHARHEEEVDFPRLRTALDHTARIRLARDLHREKSLVL